MDSVRAGDGDDYVTDAYGVSRIFGGRGSDRIILTQRSESDRASRIYGGPGDDTLHGSWALEEMHGGPGADTLVAGFQGGDDFYGGPGRDILRGSGGANLFFLLGDGDTVIASSASNQVLYWYATGPLNLNLDRGFGRVAGRWPYDHMSGVTDVDGTRYDDTIIGDARDNIIQSLAGDDTVYGGDGGDLISGQGGDDYLDGAAPGGTPGGFDFGEGQGGYDTCWNFGAGADCEVIGP
jgi:Ca2+-binding RTX toxin-like protein